MLCYIVRLPLKKIIWQKHAVVFGAWATTAKLYHGRDAFEFGRAHDQESTNHNAHFVE